MGRRNSAYMDMNHMIRHELTFSKDIGKIQVRQLTADMQQGIASAGKRKPPASKVTPARKSRIDK